MEPEARWSLYNKYSKNTINVNKINMSVGRLRAADIICISDKISRHHAKISVGSEGDLFVFDNGSVNGTYINCQKITSNVQHKLNAKDELGFGLHSGIEYEESHIYIFEVIDERMSELENGNCEKLVQESTVTKDPIEEPQKIVDVREPTETRHNGFTISDSVIVIEDDDESDNEFAPCSQLLNDRRNGNCQNAAELCDSGMFSNIKRELQEWEEGSDGFIVTDEIEVDHPVTSTDLIALLEGEGDTSVSSNNQGNKILPQEEPLDKIEENKSIAIPSTSTGVSSTTRSKFRIPPVISPHQEVPRSRKRKSTVESSSVQSKLKKKSKLSSPLKTAKQKLDIKNKLKEVAMKEKTKIVVEKPKPTLSAPSKVKVSESRGSFLVNTSESKPSTVKKCNQEKSTFVIPRKVPDAPSTSTPQPNSSIVKITYGNFIMSRTYSELEDILSQIVSWNPTWFTEKNSTNSLPPINKKPLTQMKNSFRSYSEYHNVVMPLMIVELWHFLCREYDSCGDSLKDNRIKCHLNRCTNGFKFIELECCKYISREDNEQGRHVKEEDIVFLDVVFENNKKHRGLYLGFVSNVTKKILRNNYLDKNMINDEVPFAIVSFKVLMKTSKEMKNFKKTMDLVMFTNLVTVWRLFKAIKYLKYSPLCNHILMPSHKNYLNILDTNLNVLVDSSLTDNLNHSQKCAVAEATQLFLQKLPGIRLIQGPPGTGKTTVIVSIIKQILLTSSLQADHCILLLAPTNVAIDELVLRLVDMKTKVDVENRKKLKIIRLGPQNMINAITKKFSLADLARNHIVNICLQKFCGNLELQDIQNKINCLKGELTKDSKTEDKLNYQKKMLEKKCRELMGRNYKSEIDSVEVKLLQGATVICTTLSSCVGTRMEEVFGKNRRKISCCIVDEATYSKEQDTFVPLLLGISKLILIGDPKQLPGMMFSKEAKEYGHGNSLFTRIMSNFNNKYCNPVRLLNIQYRMHPDICSFPNNTFYNGLLMTDRSVTNRKNEINNLILPYLVFQMDNNVKMITPSQEYKNYSEMDFILKLVKAIVLTLPKSTKIEIGVITPYNQQKKSIEQIIKDNGFNSNVMITVNTVDSFQGQEKDIIILSSVRTFTNNFLSDNQRLNVALTRARYSLYVIGKKNLFETCENYGKLWKDAKKRKLTRSVPLNIEVPLLKKLIKCNNR